MSDTWNNIRHSTLAMLEAGKSGCQIARELNVSPSFVSKQRRFMTIKVKKAVGGRPSKLSPHDHRYLSRLICSRKADNASQLLKITGFAVSKQTVRNALKKEGMKAIVKAKKPLLKIRHKRARLEFARKYRDWTIEDWKQVIWSDETKINRFGSDGRVWVWKKSEHMRTEQHMKPTVKKGGGSLMIWGCMTPQGVGFMCKIDGTMNGELYREILDDNLMDTLKYYHIPRDKFIFQQDNDPKHTAKLTWEWFKDHKIKVLDWPAQSPDLNPIEHLWAELEKRLNSYENHPSSMTALWERVEEEWEKIPKEVCMNLIESMPRRLEAVIRAKGAPTKY
jgi:transposase